MAVAGIAGFHAASQPTAQSSATHQHGGHRSNSMADIDSLSSSVASPPSSTGKIGSKVDIKV